MADVYTYLDSDTFMDTQTIDGVTSYLVYKMTDLEASKTANTAQVANLNSAITALENDNSHLTALLTVGTGLGCVE